QIFDFKRITVKDATEYLKYIAEQQGVEAEEGALHIIAQKADGAMRDALSIFDRVVSFSGKNLTRKAVTENLNVLDYEVYLKTTEFILDNNIPALLMLFNETLSNGFDGHHFIIGLASHFRDLMVCQHPETQGLLEVSEDAKADYAKQAALTSKAFLLQALDIANEADIKYKVSKNQRLLVELALMKLASITFDGEKKNREFLIPASHVRGMATLKPPVEATVPLPKNISEIQIQEPQKVVPTPTEAVQAAMVETEAPISQEVEASPKPIAIAKSEKRVSGLSLSSIKAKKEHQNTKKPDTVDEELPEEAFTEAQMLEHWNTFVAHLEGKGKKILASNLQTDVPKLKDENTLWIELPNSTMKKEIEREQGGLMQYLRENLNNHAISLHITVNEEVAKKFAFTPEEKYEKLKEKNPAIELLRKEFDLDF
ncbi:MAG: DNA polymerase III subunit gamma/tau, partial [Bacteroidota bacterium]